GVGPDGARRRSHGNSRNKSNAKSLLVFAGPNRDADQLVAVGRWSGLPRVLPRGGAPTHSQAGAKIDKSGELAGARRQAAERGLGRDTQKRIWHARLD